MAFGYGVGMAHPDLTEGAAGAVGAALGVSQTMLLREFVDNDLANTFITGASSGATPPLLMKQFKGFGSASALAGIIGGGVATIVGGYSAYSGRWIRGRATRTGILGYGGGALASGIISGALPTPAWKNGIAVDPSNPVRRGTSIRRAAAAAPSELLVR